MSLGVGMLMCSCVCEGVDYKCGQIKNWNLATLVYQFLNLKK